MRPCRPARRGWPSRPARTCTRWTAACHDPPGPGPGSAPRDRLYARRHHLPATGRRARPGTEPGLKCGLIHLRPAAFTNGRVRCIRAGCGRWRILVNAGQHCWKGCWVQALASSNLASSATLTCMNVLGGYRQGCLDVKICLSFCPRNGRCARSQPRSGKPGDSLGGVEASCEVHACRRPSRAGVRWAATCSLAGMRRRNP